MKRLVALGFSVVFAMAALGARPADAAVPDRLEPFVGQFQGQSGPKPGSLYTPLWSKPTPFDLSVERHNDELVFAVSGANSVIMRFVPISDRLYVLRTNRGANGVKESGFAWVDGETLTHRAQAGTAGQTNPRHALRRQLGRRPSPARRLYAQKRPGPGRGDGYGAQGRRGLIQLSDAVEGFQVTRALA